MGTRERRADRGRRLARNATARVIEDIRQARVGAGLSIRTAARALGVSHSRVARLERGEVRAPTTDFLGAYCSVVGLDLHLRTYPAGDPLRDRAHVALLARFRQELHRDLRWRTEVPLGIPDDLRAWDGEIRGEGWSTFVEAEMRIGDGQALERRLALKMRDSGADRVILLVADTRTNRAALAVLREGWRDRLPLDTREVLAAVRAGKRPKESGIVVM
jgi:transcriptional regulator with XRE-family HTH domain